MILEEAYKFLISSYKEEIESLKIDDVRIGAHLTVVRLSDNSCGVAGTLVDKFFHHIKENRDYGDFTPLHIKGQNITTLFETEKKSGVIDTLRIAVLNAISSTLLTKGKYRIIENTDPIELLDFSDIRKVAVVGAFHSYIKKIADAGKDLVVLELNEATLTEEYKKYYCPANEYSRVLPESDTVIITGFTLVNNTIDGLLEAIRPGTNLVVTGPSSSIIPEILFRHHVNIIGATRITDPEQLFAVVSEFGTGYHLFRYCATKICIMND
jgi:uncharacterized protein